MVELFVYQVFFSLDHESGPRLINNPENIVDIPLRREQPSDFIRPNDFVEHLNLLRPGPVKNVLIRIEPVERFQDGELNCGKFSAEDSRRGKSGKQKRRANDQLSFFSKNGSEYYSL